MGAEFTPIVPTVLEDVKKAFEKIEEWDIGDQVAEYKHILLDVVALAGVWEHNALRWADPLLPSPKIAELCDILKKLGD
jgi:hypothetical protein